MYTLEKQVWCVFFSAIILSATNLFLSGNCVVAQLDLLALRWKTNRFLSEPRGRLVLISRVRVLMSNGTSGQSVIVAIPCETPATKVSTACRVWALLRDLHKVAPHAASMCVSCRIAKGPESTGETQLGVLTTLFTRPVGFYFNSLDLNYISLKCAIKSSLLIPLTCQVIVFFTLMVSQWHQLLEEKRVLEHSLNRLDEIRLQRGGVLLGGIPGIQKSLEGLVGFSCNQWVTDP